MDDASFKMTKLTLADRFMITISTTLTSIKSEGTIWACCSITQSFPLHRC